MTAKRGNVSGERERNFSIKNNIDEFTNTDKKKLKKKNIKIAKRPKIVCFIHEL